MPRLRRAAVLTAALSLTLPGVAGAADQRVYEQVSDNAGNATEMFAPQGFGDGDHAAYTTFNHPLPDSNSGSETFLVTRTAAGWNAAPIANGGSRYTGYLDALSQDGTRWLTSDLDTTGYTVTNLVLRGPGSQQRRINPVDGSFAYADATADLGKVLFYSPVTLDPAKPHDGHSGLYLDDGTSAHLVSVGAGGTPDPCGPYAYGAFLSPDGSHAVWAAATDPPTCSDASRQLWLYDAASGTSTEISVNGQTGTAGTPTFVGGDASFANVYFRTTSKLEAGDANGTEDLYRYTTGTGTWMRISKTADGDDASVTSAAVSDDGGHVYFVAGKAFGGHGTDGASNVYAWSPGGGLAYVATSTDPVSLETTNGYAGPPVSADGTALLFASTAITAPAPAVYSGPKELLRYSATGDALTCVSCAAGVTPTGDADRDGAGGAPTSMQLSADGEQVAFVTTTALVSADTNGRADAYLYDHGQIQLISPGDYSSGVTTGDDVTLSRDGRDYFFVTTQQLAGPAVGDAKLFDARVGGGFPPATTATPCDGDACQGAPSALPALPASGTAVFSGPGNVVPAAPPVKVVSIAPQRLTAAQRRAFARTGRLALKVRVTGGITVVARVTGRLKRRTRTLARASRTPPGSRAQLVTLALRLSTTARRELSRRGRLKVKVSISAAGATTRSVSLTLVHKRG